jgi:hypothetical protein
MDFSGLIEYPAALRRGARPKACYMRFKIAQDAKVKRKIPTPIENRIAAVANRFTN